MERFETDAVADDLGMVHLAVGRPGLRVHVSVEPVETPGPAPTALQRMREHLASSVWPDVDPNLIGRRWTPDERRTLLGVDAE